MREFLHQLYLTILDNLTAAEGMILALLALIILFHAQKSKALPTLYSVFFVLYITLLRRGADYGESFWWNLRLQPSAAVWAGNLLNLLLFLPFGWSCQRRGCSFGRTVLLGFGLSAVCELVQHLTRRGIGDVNDLLFNTLGAVCGFCLAWLFSKWTR